MPKLPNRTARLEFEGDYEGIWVTVKLNVKLKTLLELQELQGSQDAGSLRLGFETFGREALLEWNLEDEDGKPVPAGAEGMLEIDPAFAMMLMEQWVQAVSQPAAPLVAPSPNGNTSEGAWTPPVESSLNLADFSGPNS